MNHLALNVAPDKIDEYREKLVAKGIDVSEVKYQTMDENCRPYPDHRRQLPDHLHEVDLLP